MPRSLPLASSIVPDNLGSTPPPLLLYLSTSLLLLSLAYHSLSNLSPQTLPSLLLPLAVLIDFTFSGVWPTLIKLLPTYNLPSTSISTAVLGGRLGTSLAFFVGSRVIMRNLKEGKTDVWAGLFKASSVICGIGSVILAIFAVIERFDPTFRLTNGAVLSSDTSKPPRANHHPFSPSSSPLVTSS